MTYETASLSPSRGRGPLSGYEIRYTADPPRLRYGVAPARATSPADAKVRAQLDPQPDLLDCIGVHYSEVDLAPRRTFDVVLAPNVQSLGLPWSTRCHWYRPTTGTEWPRFQTHVDARGFVERSDTFLNTIWIKVAKADTQLVRTIAHELRHLYHHRCGRWPESEAEREAAETDAWQWAEQVADLVSFDQLTGMPFRCA